MTCANDNSEPGARRLRKINEAFRKDPDGSGIPGEVRFVGRLALEPPTIKARALDLVRNFDDFDDCQNPISERNSGQVELHLEGSICWKIESHPSDLSGGVVDPTDLSSTKRFLVVYFDDFHSDSG